MSTSICTSRSRTRMSMCTMRTMPMLTTSPGTAASRIRMCIATRGCATVIRTIRICTTGTGTRNGPPACAGTAGSGGLAGTEPEFLGVELAVAVAIGDVEGACHGVIAPRLVARDKAVGVAIEGAEGMRDIRSGLALEAAAGGQRCYSNHQSANHAFASAGFVPAHGTLALFSMGADVADLKILGISGSLRKNSYNMAALKACAEAMQPLGMMMTYARLDDIPLFNQDVFDAGMPEPAQRFRSEVTAADGVLIASPEYNFSLSAALKNAIDWASRPPNQSWQDKPIAIFSASQGPMGGARVQYDARRILGQLWGHVLPRPEVFIGNAASKFDGQGKLTDEATRKFLTEFVTGFKTWIVRMQLKK